MESYHCSMHCSFYDVIMLRLCGAVAGAQIVIGGMFGKTAERDGMQARKMAKQFNEMFAEKYKVNCCKVLSAGFDFHSQERKNHCTNMVGDSCEILENILSNNTSPIS